MTLERAIADIEANYTVREGSAACSAQTGERYITVTSDGARYDYDPVRTLFTDESDAVKAWLWKMAAYSAENRGKFLYWRRRPEIRKTKFLNMETHDFVELKYVYCRLVTSEIDAP